VQQWQNYYAGYGQGGEGYAKRYGASYGDFFFGTMIGGAILPSLMKQDPRYYFKGTGSTGSRIVHALKFSVLRKGDNQRWQPNYSGILGGLAAAGISNAYRPEGDRDSAGTTFRNAAVGIAFESLGNLFQEFVAPKLTPKRKKP
jgi:hypothetical protein